MVSALRIICGLVHAALYVIKLFQQASLSYDALQI